VGGWGPAKKIRAIKGWGDAENEISPKKKRSKYNREEEKTEGMLKKPRKRQEEKRSTAGCSTAKTKGERCHDLDTRPPDRKNSKAVTKGERECGRGERVGR